VSGRLRPPDAFSDAKDAARSTRYFGVVAGRVVATKAFRSG
jgi:hypothetical protein